MSSGRWVEYVEEPEIAEIPQKTGWEIVDEVPDGVKVAEVRSVTTKESEKGA